MNRSHETFLKFLKDRFGEIYYEVLGDVPIEDIGSHRYDKAVKVKMLISAPRLTSEGPITQWANEKLEIFFLDQTGRHYSSPIPLRSRKVNNVWPKEADVFFDQSKCHKVWDFDNIHGYYVDVTWVHLNDSALQIMKRVIYKPRSTREAPIFPPSFLEYSLREIEFSQATNFNPIEQLDFINLRNPNRNTEESLTPYQRLMQEPLYAHRVSSQLPKEHKDSPDYPYLRYHEKHRVTAHDGIIGHDWKFEKNYHYKPTNKAEWENALIDSLNLYHYRTTRDSDEMPETSWNRLKNRYFDPMSDFDWLFKNPNKFHGYDNHHMNIFSSRYESVERNIYLHVSPKKIIEFKRIDPNSIFPRFYSPNEKSELFKEIEKILSTSPGDSKFRNDRYDLIKPHETFFDYLKKLFFTSEADMVEKIIDDDRSNW